MERYRAPDSILPKYALARHPTCIVAPEYNNCPDILPLTCPLVNSARASLCPIMHSRQVEDLAGVNDVAKRAGEGVDEVRKRAAGGNDDSVECASGFLERQGEKVRTGMTTLFEDASIFRLN
jgi:hypothetical protein